MVQDLKVMVQEMAVVKVKAAVWVKAPVKALAQRKVERKADANLLK
jgi:hypothetical protein